MKNRRRIRCPAAPAGLVSVLLLASAGCGRVFHESLLREGIAGPEAPDWVTGDPQRPDMPDEVFFVGRSVGYTVLDEPALAAAAREDVRKQLADLISTRVVGVAHNCDHRANPDSGFCRRGILWFTSSDDERYVRFLPGSELAQLVEREACLFSNGVAGELVERGAHFEQWDVRDDPSTFWGRASRGNIRYKCWLLMSIPRDKLERRIEDFRGQVAAAYERFLEDRQRALAWIEQDRERRIEREEQERLWAREDQLVDRKEAQSMRTQIMRSHSNVSFRVTGAQSAKRHSLTTVNPNNPTVAGN